MIRCTEREDSRIVGYLIGQSHENPGHGKSLLSEYELLTLFYLLPLQQALGLAGPFNQMEKYPWRN